MAMALQVASEELTADQAIGAMVVQHNGRALRYASEELRVDPDIRSLIV